IPPSPLPSFFSNFQNFKIKIIIALICSYFSSTYIYPTPGKNAFTAPKFESPHFFGEKNCGVLYSERRGKRVSEDSVGLGFG
ncbi:hypothetical protein VIGAN_04186800, partial [Vigna angularis var. angularis]